MEILSEMGNTGLLDKWYTFAKSGDNNNGYFTQKTSKPKYLCELSWKSTDMQHSEMELALAMLWLWLHKLKYIKYNMVKEHDLTIMANIPNSS